MRVNAAFINIYKKEDSVNINAFHTSNLGSTASELAVCMGASLNCLAKGMRVIRRIAKEAILHDLCQEGVGVSVK